jgi:hypothetical protein
MRLTLIFINHFHGTFYYSYEAPDLSVMEALVERGFAATEVASGNAGKYTDDETDY